MKWKANKIKGSESLLFRKYTCIIYLPGVLKTGLPEILSQVQHIAGNLSTLNLLKALILLVYIYIFS